MSKNVQGPTKSVGGTGSIATRQPAITSGCRNDLCECGWVLSGIAQIYSTSGTVASHVATAQLISGQRPNIYLVYIPCPFLSIFRLWEVCQVFLFQTHTNLSGTGFPIVKGLKRKRRKRRIFLQLHELRAGEKREEHIARASGPILYEAILHCGLSYMWFDFQQLSSSRYQLLLSLHTCWWFSDVFCMEIVADLDRLWDVLWPTSVEAWFAETTALPYRCRRRFLKSPQCRKCANQQMCLPNGCETLAKCAEFLRLWPTKNKNSRCFKRTSLNFIISPNYSK